MNCLKIIMGSLILSILALYNVQLHAQEATATIADEAADVTAEPEVQFQSNPVVQELPEPPDYSRVWLDGRVSLVGGNYNNNEMTRSERQFRYAEANGIPFARNERDYQDLVARGQFVRLRHPALTIAARRPYVLPTTAQFIYEIADAFSGAGCRGLRINDAARLVSERPSNGSVYSVHPAGMALDLRVINLSARCYEVLTNILSMAEMRGQADATREHRPPHFHVVVVQDSRPRIDDLVARYPVSEPLDQSE